MSRASRPFAEHIKDFTPEEMAPICGIAADTLREVARTYARAESAIIFWGMGVSQHTHGTDNARCLIALSLITGQIGRPGTGLHPLRGQNNVQGASDAGLIPMFFPDYKSVEAPEIRAKYEKVWGAKLDPKKGLTVVEIMDAVHADEIKGMYILGENPAMSDPDLNHAREALAHLEHLVVQDLFLTETAGLCRRGPAGLAPGRRRTAPSPTPTARCRWAAPRCRCRARPSSTGGSPRRSPRRIGLNWNYHASERDLHRDGLADAVARQHLLGAGRARERGDLSVRCARQARPRRGVRQGLPAPRRLRQAGGGQAHAAGRDAGRTNIPFILTTGRQLEHWHTGAMTRRATVLDALEPGPVAALSRGTIAKLGIKPGDMVRVSTRRGAVELAARQDDAMPDGVVFIPFAFCRGGGQPADQSGARSVRQDSGIQVLRREGGAGDGAAARGGGVGAAPLFRATMAAITSGARSHSEIREKTPQT